MVVGNRVGTSFHDSSLNKGTSEKSSVADLKFNFQTTCKIVPGKDETILFLELLNVEQPETDCLWV